MKNVLKFLSLFLILSLVVISCGKDDDSSSNDCTTDPTVTVEENIPGVWIIDGESNETVTFNSDGTGFSSIDASYFNASNDGKDYHKFNWSVENNETVVIEYDYTPDTPVVPFLISLDYTVLLNNCGKLELKSGFGSNLELTR